MLIVLNNDIWRSTRYSDIRTIFDNKLGDRRPRVVKTYKVELLKRAHKILLIILGTLCVALGLLGVFLPVLPTTPFLLLAAICYGRSSKRFYNWLMTNRWFGEYLRNYCEGKGIPLKHKIQTMLLLWLTIGLTAWLVVTLWWVRLILLGIAIGVTIHLVWIKTYKPDTRYCQHFEKNNSPDKLD